MIDMFDMFDMLVAMSVCQPLALLPFAKRRSQHTHFLCTGAILRGRGDGVCRMRATLRPRHEQQPPTRHAPLENRTSPPAFQQYHTRTQAVPPWDPAALACSEHKRPSMNNMGMICARTHAQLSVMVRCSFSQRKPTTQY